MELYVLPSTVLQMAFTLPMSVWLLKSRPFNCGPVQLKVEALVQVRMPAWMS